MHVVYALEDPPESFTSSIFLAGPSPRQPDHPNWRIEALKLLNEMGYGDDEGAVVFIPLTRDNAWEHSYSNQLDWETKCLNMADVIVFWVPRDLETLPAFTTNIEYGTWMHSGKIVVGFPPTAPKMGPWAYHNDVNLIPTAMNLSDTLMLALDRIGPLGDLTVRTGGQREVPLDIWRTASFQSWLAAQEGAGNRLDGARVEWVFRVGPRKNIVFFWCLHVDVYIAAEDRHKTNEVVLSRPDISTIVAYHNPISDDLKDDPCYPATRAALLDIEVAIVKEFRSPAVTPDGYIREIPGGSSWKDKENAEDIAADELNEETGLSVTGDRFKFIDSRQVAGTLSAHFAHVFAVELTREEMDKLKADMGVHGVEEDTERTYVDVTTLRELIGPDNVDWANVGMIMTALLRGA